MQRLRGFNIENTSNIFQKLISEFLTTMLSFWFYGSIVLFFLHTPYIGWWVMGDGMLALYLVLNSQAGFYMHDPMA